MSIDKEINFLFQQANAANSNKRVKAYKKYQTKLLTIVLIFFIGYFTHFVLSPNQLKSAFATDLFCNETTHFLSPTDKIKFRETVKKIALKEHKHPNTIHAELRKVFNYRSYHDLDKSQYNKICAHLNNRL